MLEIIINGNSLEVPKESIKYNIQCNDIGDLESRQCNYTDGFSIPKTLENTRYFEHLGLVGDVSTLPYQKVNADLIDNGVHLIRGGWLEIQETAKEYKINIRDGIIDLFKAIENKNFGDNVNLTEIDHSKDLTTIINSFTNENYRYIINDYGGLTHLDTLTKINIDYLVPSARVKYLWNKIFTTFGFQYEGDVFNTSDFEGLWLTYPKGISLEDVTETTLYADLASFDGNKFLDIDLFFGNLINDVVYVVPTTGSYKITFIAYFEQENQVGVIEYVPVSLLLNDQAIYSFGGTYNIQLNQGDTLNFPYDPVYTDPTVFGTLRVEKYNTSISFSEELKQLTITDFMKEILWRFNLTIFQDINGKYIFKTFDERLQSGVIDWSEKYKERTSETYIPKGYAQKNYFRQNYNDKEGNFNDGYFTVNNQNLSDTKNILSSKFYSYDKELVTFTINSTTQELFNPTPLWEKEANENAGVQDIRYKDLSGRFYLLRNETINKSSVLASDVLGVNQSVTSLPVARFYMTTFKDFIPKYYGNIQTLLNDFRFHKMKIELSNLDVHNLDLDKIYYFEQEQNYYFINKVSYSSGKISNAEFYRVKYSESDNFVYSSFITSVTSECVYFTLSDNYTYNLVQVEWSIDNGLNWSMVIADAISPICLFNFNQNTILRLKKDDSNEVISPIYFFTP